MKWTGWFKRTQAGAGSGVGSPFGDPAVQALRDAAADAQRSRLPQMAAALSFRTVFGLIPMLVISLLLVRHYTSRQDRTQIIHNVIEYAGLDTLTFTADPLQSLTQKHRRRSSESDAGADSAATLNEDTPFVGPPSPSQQPPPPPPASQGLADLIIKLIDRGEASISIGTISLIGLITLAYAAIAMLVEIERAFNQVFRVPRGRSWFRRIVNYWTLLTLGGVMLFMTFYVGAKFQVWSKDIAEQRGLQFGSGELTVHIIGYAVTVLISTVLLSVIYTTVPNTRVKAWAAIMGAFLGALLWEAGKWGFGQYIIYSAGYARMYGSLALLPLFLLWVYYTWLIVLFGLEVTFQLQYGRSRTSAQPLSDFGPTIVEPSAGLLVMTTMARAMAAGTPQSIKVLTIATGLSEPVVTMVVSRFAERGLLLRVERGGGPSTADPLYALARTPGSIRVGEILAIGFDLAGGPESNPVIERMRKAQIDAAGSETLAEAAGLTNESPKAPTIVATAAAKPVQNPVNGISPANGSTAPAASPTPRPATLR